MEALALQLPSSPELRAKGQGSAQGATAQPVVSSSSCAPSAQYQAGRVWLEPLRSQAALARTGGKVLSQPKKHAGQRASSVAQHGSPWLVPVPKEPQWEEPMSPTLCLAPESSVTPGLLGTQFTVGEECSSTWRCYPVREPRPPKPKGFLKDTWTKLLPGAGGTGALEAPGSAGRLGICACLLQCWAQRVREGHAGIGQSHRDVEHGPQNFTSWERRGQEAPQEMPSVLSAPSAQHQAAALGWSTAEPAPWHHRWLRGGGTSLSETFEYLCKVLPHKLIEKLLTYDLSTTLI